MITLATTSVDETRAVAAALASRVVAGDLLLLSGDLGAGKTAFVQGFATALGVDDDVTSPTFTLAQRYQGRLTVHHLDVYRLTDLAEVVDLAIPELLDGDTVTLIEWGDVIESALPPDHLDVDFTLGDGDDDRTITLGCIGQRWASRMRLLADDLRPWAVTPC